MRTIPLLNIMAIAVGLGACTGDTPVPGDDAEVQSQVLAIDYYFIRNKQTGNVIDVSGGNPTPGTPLIAFTRKATGADNQLWTLIPSGASGYYFLKSKQ